MNWWRIPTGFIAVASTVSALGDFLELEPVVQMLESVGVPAWAIPVLGVLKLLGVGGLVVGLRFAPLGALAATCLVAYYGTAFALHAVGGQDLASGAPALGLAVVSALAIPGYRSARTAR